MISNDLSWAAHDNYICPNANRRLYFVCMLRRAGASHADLLSFYKAYVRSAVEYASTVWHTGLTGEQADCIESVQRWALRIIEPGLSHHEALALTGLETLHTCRERMTQAFFEAILSPGHKLHHLLPDPRLVNYGPRHWHCYPATSLRTQRACRTLINYGIDNWQYLCKCALLLLLLLLYFNVYIALNLNLCNLFNRAGTDCK